MDTSEYCARAGGVLKPFEIPENCDVRVAQNGQLQYPSDYGSKENTPCKVQVDDVPPDGGYGWVCVACVFLINAHTWGINSVSHFYLTTHKSSTVLTILATFKSYGVFLSYYLTHDYFPGATSLDFAFIGGLSISQALLIAPIATVVTRISGTRNTLLIGVFLETLSLIGASFSTKIWHLFLSQGICFGWGMGFLFVASVGITPQWFTSKRSLANGVAAAGSGLGGLMWSLVASHLIRTVSFGWALRVLGIASFGVNTVCAILIKDRTKRIGSSQLAFDYPLFQLPEFNMMQGWGFLSMLAYVVLLFSLPNYATTIGLNAHQGSVINAVLQLGQMLGRPPMGFFSDSFGRLNMAMTMTFLAGLFCLVIWVFARTYGVLIFFAFIVGTVAGTYWATIAPVGAEVVGLKALPSALSITWIMLVLPCTFSEVMGLEIAERSPIGYLGSQLFAGFCYIGAALCLWWVRAWKIGQLELATFEKQTVADAAFHGENASFKISPLWMRLIAWRKV